ATSSREVRIEQEQIIDRIFCIGKEMKNIEDNFSIRCFVSKEIQFENLANTRMPKQFLTKHIQDHPYENPPFKQLPSLWHRVVSQKLEKEKRGEYVGGGCDPFKRMHVRDPISLGVSSCSCFKRARDDEIP
ncbi:unnamed protein product, partial [Heterotrigona itama]